MTAGVFLAMGAPRKAQSLKQSVDWGHFVDFGSLRVLNSTFGATTRTQGSTSTLPFPRLIVYPLVQFWFPTLRALNPSACVGTMISFSSLISATETNHLSSCFTVTADSVFLFVSHRRQILKLAEIPHPNFIAFAEVGPIFSILLIRQIQIVIKFSLF